MAASLSRVGVVAVVATVAAVALGAVVAVAAWSGSSAADLPADLSRPVVVTPGVDGTPAPAASTPATPAPAAPSGDIGVDAAVAIALSDAGVAAADATVVGSVQSHSEYDHGVLTYDVEFYVGNTEYDYEIRAADGVILSLDYDIDDFSVDHSSAWPTVASGPIDREGAVAIVLARVPGADADSVLVHLDEEEGRPTWEGWLLHEGREYEFSIDAATGWIVEWDVELQ
jgi:uncharacterized membrane protein YkoI